MKLEPKENVDEKKYGRNMYREKICSRLNKYKYALIVWIKFNLNSSQFTKRWNYIQSKPEAEKKIIDLNKSYNKDTRKGEIKNVCVSIYRRRWIEMCDICRYIGSANLDN